jgi:hypothetical protein
MMDGYGTTIEGNTNNIGSSLQVKLKVQVSNCHFEDQEEEQIMEQVVHQLKVQVVCH